MQYGDKVPSLPCIMNLEPTYIVYSLCFVLMYNVPVNFQHICVRIHACSYMFKHSGDIISYTLHIVHADVGGIRRELSDTQARTTLRIAGFRGTKGSLLR